MARRNAKDSEIFDHYAGRRMLAAFIQGLGEPKLSWAWAVVIDTLDVIGHHSTPREVGNRAPYTGDAWLDWYGSFLHGLDAQHTVHGLARELRDACPPELAPALRRTVEDAYRACDKRTPEQRAASRLAAVARQQAGREAHAAPPAPDPRRAIFTVLEGGREQ